MVDQQVLWKKQQSSGQEEDGRFNQGMPSKNKAKAKRSDRKISQKFAKTKAERFSDFKQLIAEWELLIFPNVWLVPTYLEEF